MAIDISTIKTELLTDLATELSDEPTYDATILEVKVKSAIRELISLRRYDRSNMTDSEITEDLNNYYPQLMNVCRYDFNTIGAEGEETHNENGVNRKFKERSKMWSGVIPFGRW